jgi:hypothetical protein
MRRGVSDTIDDSVGIVLSRTANESGPYGNRFIYMEVFHTINVFSQKEGFLFLFPQKILQEEDRV